jgi:hypothetical protein
MVSISIFQFLFSVLFCFFRVSRRQIYSDQPYQRDDDLAIAAGGEGVLRGELLPDLLVVVDLSVGLFIQSFNSDAVRKRWVIERTV